MPDAQAGIQPAQIITSEPPRGIGFTAFPFVPLAGKQMADTPSIGVSNERQKTASHWSIQRKAAKSLIATGKAEKLQIEKSRGKDEAYTVKIDRQKRFRIRLTESGYSVVFTWKDGESGKWPERYCCYLSKREWASARKKSLRAFAGLVAAKIEPGKADLIRRVQSLAS